MPRSPYARFGTTAITGTQQVEQKYVVKGGDTIPSICAQVNPNAGYDSELWRQLAEANSIDDLDDLEVGQTLVIPSPQPSSN